VAAPTTRFRNKFIVTATAHTSGGKWTYDKVDVYGNVKNVALSMWESREAIFLAASNRVVERFEYHSVVGPVQEYY
jgi:hypothetical protein